MIDTRTIQPKTLKRLHTLFGKAGITDKEGKSDTIEAYTEGRTKSSKGLLEYEAIQLCNRLDNGNQPVPAPKQTNTSEQANTLRRRVIANYRTMGYQKAQDGHHVADMKRINDAVKDKWGKVLNEYSIEELKSIIGVLERNIVPHHLKKK
jgi:hypothetical protein